jgi:hypothetical protein
MMGLERLIQKTYGTTPQIDLDKQILRARVPRPMRLDFTALADGIKRANVGTAAIEIDVPFDVKDGRVILRETGQEFPLHGERAQGSRLRVLDWENPSTTRVEIVL